MNVSDTPTPRRLAPEEVRAEAAKEEERAFGEAHAASRAYAALTDMRILGQGEYLQNHKPSWIAKVARTEKRNYDAARAIFRAGIAYGLALRGCCAHEEGE